MRLKTIKGRLVKVSNTDMVLSNSITGEQEYIRTPAPVYYCSLIISHVYFALIDATNRRLVKIIDENQLRQ
jgi:hypothetical protein